MRCLLSFRFRQTALVALSLLLMCIALVTSAEAQNEVTGAFEGRVFDRRTEASLEGAAVRIINQQTDVPTARRTDRDGRFYQGLLYPGNYLIEVERDGYQPTKFIQPLYATQVNSVIPVPIPLDALPTAAAAAQPSPTSTPPAQNPTTAAADEDRRSIAAEMNRTEARRGGVFTEREVQGLPLGGTTLVRTFDELAFLLPGVALPPQTIGTTTGPGIGAGVGSAGQFSVNGLRSRANNFTVDGSDNNDEDVGVRRQGFFSLVPQSIESIQEYQVTTLLAPAQYGRNIGAQVNAVSRSGGNETHGTLYGFFNASQLNAHNFFDRTGGGAFVPLASGSGREDVLFSGRRSGTQPVLLNGTQITVRNPAGGKDSFTLGQFGAVLGGPLRANRTFYFLSAEGQILNATREESFAVPTVTQRGAFNSGASGIFLNPLDPNFGPAFAYPTTTGGDAIFSLFPFPNNPEGIYGANTFTQALPASGRGRVFSGRLDHNFQLFERQHTATARYNFTDDWRDIPVTGGALFSTLRPRVRTQNLSLFLNSELTDSASARPVFNQVRFSYGRTRLRFDERRDQSLVASSFADTPFLLNAPLVQNLTQPAAFGEENTGAVIYQTDGRTIEDVLGPVGKVDIKGFSPLGVDVFNFPQQRVNNTFQVADILTWRAGSTHNLTFGADIRRSGFRSELPRNFRPLITFGGVPWAGVNAGFTSERSPTSDFTFFPGFLYRPEDLAAAAAATSITQTLSNTTNDARADLRYYQLNFFAQDEWRINSKLSLSFGLRYEYNTPPREAQARIENSFDDPLLALVPDLPRFIAGRNSVFDSDRNNFAPRVGVAFSPNRGGTVLRAGFGIFYDQIPGVVVSQSRGVFPDYLTVNIPGGASNVDQTNTYRLNPIAAQNFVDPRRTALNSLNQSTSLADLLGRLETICTGEGRYPGADCVEATLPARQMKMPMAYHYNVTFEQQLFSNTFVSVAYVGTQGRNLLRYSTPNLGPNAFILPTNFIFDVLSKEQFKGIALAPGTRILPDGTLDPTSGRPFSGVGTINLFETTASSRYDALQLQVRGRFFGALQYQTGYTFSKAVDDVSDFFDLAGAPALPQNSLTFAGERALANFDARHRFTYNFIYDLPFARNSNGLVRFLFSDLQLASTGQFQTGQPFTVNSLFDINLDGNLSDRLNSTDGIVATGDRRQPLLLTTDPLNLIAPYGEDGSVGRNTFRAGNLLDLNFAVVKRFAIFERQAIVFRTEVFNFLNRANFGVPVRFLEAPGFGQATNTVTPGRRIQFALKYTF